MSGCLHNYIANLPYNTKKCLDCGMRILEEIWSELKKDYVWEVKEYGGYWGYYKRTFTKEKVIFT